MKEDNNNKLILIFSPREKVRNILTAGFLQSNYRIIEATTSYIAGVKANQFLPDLVIADINKNNIKDFLFLSRLERSTRTKNITVLLSVTPDVRKAIDKIHEEIGAVKDEKEDKKVYLIEYPYNFNDLIKKINSIFLKKPDEATKEPGKIIQSNMVISEKLCNFEIPMHTKLHLVESSIQKQWAFPFTVVRSLEIICSDKSCCNELAKCIESDLAATSAILSLVNKVHYSSRYGQITKVQDAVVRIGFNNTRNLLASLSLIDISPEIHLKYGFKRSEFWMHSLSTAVIAEKICIDIKIQRPELAFLAGLIHDIGKIPLDNNFTNIFSRLLDETTNRITSFYESERRLLGFTHADLGHFFTTNWNFPSYITLSILNHHNPEKILSTNIQLDRILQESVYVANLFAKALNYGHSCDEVLNAIPEKTLNELGMPDGPKEAFLNKIYTTIKLYYEYLKISTEEVIFSESQRGTKDIPIFIISSKKSFFHTIILGLKSNGFTVQIVKCLPEKVGDKGAIAFFFPEKDTPLDITLTADDNIEEKEDSSILKIFMLDGIEMEEPKKDLAKSNIIIMDSNQVDLRIVLQIIEDFYYATTM